MSTVNTKRIDFTIKHDSRGYIVIRKDGTYGQHAHIRKLITCNELIRLINQRKLPINHYLQGSCRRLLTDEEYALLKPKRQRYYNVNKGVRG